MSGLVRVDFYGDTLEAVERDGRVWVSLRRMCENLGVDVESQRRKLRDKSWATTVEITAVAEDGRQRAVTAVDLETIPLWLAGIDERKVKVEVRPKLSRYQRECARVLADHFLRRPPAATPAPRADADPLLALLDVLRDLRVRQLDQERQLAAIATQSEVVARTAERAWREAEAARQAAEGRSGSFTILAYARRTNRTLSVAEAGRVGKVLSRRLRAAGQEPRRVSDPRFGFVNLYPEPMLAEYFGD